jgi:hypothetical protein
MISEVAFRLLVAAVLSVLPTLLFLGLWRGLQALRDDALIDRMHRVHGVDPRPDVAGLVPGVRSKIPCRRCGRPTRSAAGVCEDCGRDRS